MDRRIISALATAALLLSIAGSHSKGWHERSSDQPTAKSGVGSETELVKYRVTAVTQTAQPDSISQDGRASRWDRASSGDVIPQEQVWLNESFPFLPLQIIFNVDFTTF